MRFLCCYSSFALLLVYFIRLHVWSRLVGVGLISFFPQCVLEIRVHQRRNWLEKLRHLRFIMASSKLLTSCSITLNAAVDSGELNLISLSLSERVAADNIIRTKRFSRIRLSAFITVKVLVKVISFLLFWFYGLVFCLLWTILLWLIRHFSYLSAYSRPPASVILLAIRISFVIRAGTSL